MANINDAFPSSYLKASDLKGGQPVVTIDRVEFEPVGRQKELKPVLYFAGKEKGMVLNKTNANHICNLAGSSETDEWAGIRIRLFSTHVEFQGESVEAIRVKPGPQAAPKPVPVTEPAADDSMGGSDIAF